MLDFYEVMAEADNKKGVNAWEKFAIEVRIHLTSFRSTLITRFPFRIRTIVHRSGTITLFRQ